MTALVVELTVPALAGIVVVTALLAGTLVTWAPGFLAWTDRRRQAKARAVFLADKRRDGPTRYAQGGEVPPRRIGDDTRGFILHPTPPFRWSDYARERDHLIESMDDARRRQHIADHPDLFPTTQPEKDDTP